LTHCNTGSLATAGYGTALGVIRSLFGKSLLEHAYCTETRPYNQGARLTALELVYEKIPATLITDSMAGFLMQKGKVDAVVVGADRVAANGDTANKIGTYALAVLCKVSSHINLHYFCLMKRRLRREEEEVTSAIQLTDTNNSTMEFLSTLPHPQRR